MGMFDSLLLHLRWSWQMLLTAVSSQAPAGGWSPTVSLKQFSSQQRDAHKFAQLQAAESGERASSTKMTCRLHQFEGATSARDLPRFRRSRGTLAESCSSTGSVSDAPSNASIIALGSTSHDTDRLTPPGRSRCGTGARSPARPEAARRSSASRAVPTAEAEVSSRHG